MANGCLVAQSHQGFTCVFVIPLPPFVVTSRMCASLGEWMDATSVSSRTLMLLTLIRHASLAATKPCLTSFSRYTIATAAREMSRNKAGLVRVARNGDIMHHLNMYIAATVQYDYTLLIRGSSIVAYTSPAAKAHSRPLRTQNKYSTYDSRYDRGAWCFC